MVRFSSREMARSSDPYFPVARVRAGAEVSASPRLAYLVSLIYEGNKKKWYQKTWAAGYGYRGPDRHSMVAGGCALGRRLAPQGSRYAKPLGGHPSLGRAGANRADASEARQQARPPVAGLGARHK